MSKRKLKNRTKVTKITNTFQNETNTETTRNDTTITHKFYASLSEDVEYSRFPKKDVTTLKSIHGILQTSLGMYEHCVGGKTINTEMIQSYVSTVCHFLTYIEADALMYVDGGSELLGYLTYTNICDATNYNQATVAGLLSSWGIEPKAKKGCTNLFDREEVILAFHNHMMPFDETKISKSYKENKEHDKLHNQD